MNTILCPHCRKEVEITEAFKHQIEQQVSADVESRHKKELEETLEKAEEKARKKATEELSLQLKDKDNESREMKERLEKLGNQLLTVNKTNRELQTKQQEQQLEMQRKLQSELEKIQKEKMEALRKIKETVKREVLDEQRMKDLEKDKKISDMLKQIEELKMKAQQGSMQTQGEVLELDVENMLRRAFPEDTIEAVGKGVTGADIRHIVKSPRGIICGVILWESKRTKLWSDGWITKLKADLRHEKAHIPAIISEVLPVSCRDGMGLLEGVWICSPKLALTLAMLLRKCLLDVGYQKAISSNKIGKAESLYSYITSHEFQQQVESIVETFRDMQNQLMKERTIFEKLWSQREAQIMKMLKSTATMYGSMQGIAGAAMPQIKGMELDGLTDGETKQLEISNDVKTEE